MDTDAQKLSLVKGETHPPLWHKSLGSFVDEQSARYGERPAIVSSWQSSTLSYRQLADRSRLVAEALYRQGLRHGDCVGIMAGNRFEYIEAFLGASRLGCPAVVLNSTYTSHELQNALYRSECRLLFIASHIGSRDMSESINVLRQKQTENTDSLSKSTRIVVLGEEFSFGDDDQVVSYTRFVSNSAADGVTALEVGQATDLVSPDDVINLQFTSGTTGAPKAAMLTSVNIINDGRFVGDSLKLSPNDVVCCPPPLFHCFGLVLGFLACFTHGSSIIFPSDSFNAALVVQSIIDERATVLHGVPTMFVAELEFIQKTGKKPTSLRCGLSAGSSLPEALGRQLRTQMGLDKVIIGYGMTETSPVTFITDLEDSLEKSLTSIGRIIPHTMGKVVDERGNILPRGQRGELCTAGFALQKGYFKNREKTDEVMKRDENGTVWMHTGDEVMIDNDGYAYITGRIKDMIIRGGENIFPGEIEDRLLSHPSITEASVVGIEHNKYGEVVGAFLRLASDANSRPSHGEIHEWTTQKLGRHKAPTHVFWIGQGGVVEDYPKTGSGKYQKHLLRAIGNKAVKESDTRSKL